jgi:Domain of unknown function (DUF4131)/Competence protein
MKRPLGIAVAFYAAGLLLAAVFQPAVAALFLISFVILVLAFVLEKFRPVLICVLLALAGWTNLTLHTAINSPNDLRNMVGSETEIATVRGILIQTPQLKISDHDGEPTEHSLALVRVVEIHRDENWHSVLGEIIVSTPGQLAPNFFAGQTVEISGVIARPPPPLAEGLFDDRDYLQTRGIFYEFKTSSTNDWQLRGPILLKPPLTDRFLNWAKRTLAFGLPVQDEPLRLLWAMTLGWRTAFTGDIGDPFLRPGTMHLFAIDGLRIALISGMLIALLRVLQVSRAWCDCDSRDLVLQRRDGLGIVCDPRVGDDDNCPWRLGVETSGRFAQFPRCRRVHHFTRRAAPAFRGELSTLFLRHARHRTAAAANEQIFRRTFEPRTTAAG